MSLSDRIAAARANPGAESVAPPEPKTMGTISERIAEARRGAKAASVPSRRVTPAETTQSPSEPSPRASQEGSKLGIDDLLDDSNWGAVSAYMEDRTGMTERDYSREEIRDSFVNGMRGFNAGNSVDVVMEMNYLYRGEDGELEERRNKASSAYELWDSLGGAFGSQNTGMQKIDAVADYARSLIADPVNIVSLGVGKGVAAAASKGSSTALKVLAKTGADAAVKTAAKRGVKGEALEKVRAQTAKAIERQGFKALGVKEGVDIGAKAAVRKDLAEIGGSAAFDSAAAVAADAGTQKVDRMVGRQDEYNVAQGAANAALGVVGGALAGGFVAVRGIGKLSSTGKSIARENERLEETLKVLAEPKGAAARIAEAVETDDQAMQQAMLGWLTPFKELVEKGRSLDEGEGLTREAADEQTTALFFRGLALVFEEAGVPIDKLDARAGQRRTGWVYNTIMDENFPPQWKAQVEDMFNDVVKTVDGTPADLEEFLLLGADKASKYGRGLNAFGLANRSFKKSGLLKAGMDVDLPDKPLGAQVEEVLGEKPPANIGEKIWDGIGGVQHGFIRMLVTHPGTTMLNVVGWGNASAMESYSDVIRGTLYGGVSVLKKLSGDKKGAQEYASSATHMFRLQKQKFANLLDYDNTMEEALEYLLYRPEAQKELFSYLAGGIETKDLVNKLNLAPGEKLSKGALGKSFDNLQVLYGVSAQDMLTKTQQFMYAIDKQISLKYGQSFNDFMARKDLLDIFADPRKGPAYMEFKEVEAKALKQALGTVFARKMGDKQNSGLLNFTATTIEEIRNVPVIGALLPFGQFFNNTIAFMSDHVGASLILRGAKVTSGDPMELLTKAAAGWSVIGWATANEMENLENGLAWYEERDSDGKIVSKLYDFPLSFTKMAGRVGAHILRDGTVPIDLIDTINDTFTLSAVTKSLDETGEKMLDTITAFTSGEQGEGLSALRVALESITGMYLSGFTRALDPVNKALAFAEGEDFVEPSRKIGNAGLNNGIRYVDRIADKLLGSIGLEGLESLPFDTEGYRVENNSATNDRDLGADPAVISGSRESVPTSYIGRMFNDIGRAKWNTELYTENPMAQEVLEEYAFPILERLAKRQFQGDKWESNTLKQKQDQLKELIVIARADIKAEMQRAYKGPVAQAQLIIEINNRRSAGSSTYNRVLREYDVKPETLDDLSVNQLYLLLNEMREEQSNDKDDVERALN